MSRDVSFDGFKVGAIESPLTNAMDPTVSKIVTVTGTANMMYRNK